VESFDPTKLLPLDWQLSEAWRHAAAELGVRVTAPFELPVGSQMFQYGALVAGFATPAGVLLRAMRTEFHPDDCGAIWSEASDAGYLPINVCPSLCQFDREAFVKFLKTFKWCGRADERPCWHAGTPLEDAWDLWHA
jgi:hypothetical protein